MATFLELCGSLARESGAVGTSPAAVTNQTGRQLKAVNWVITAWKLIQNVSAEWDFLRGDWSGTLTVGATTYTGASFSIDRFAEFLGDRYGETGLFRTVTLYDTDIGQEDESELVEIPFEAWRRCYDRGTHDAGRPTRYCIAPDGSIRFGAKPDKAYMVRGEYRKTPQILAVNDDEPDMPVRFHDIIVWRAIMLMADHDEAPPALSLAQGKYLEQMATMQRDLLPRIVMAHGPLA